MLAWNETKYKEKPKKRKTPLEPNDHPELDISKESNNIEIKEFQSMIGPFKWIVLLGRFDIFSAVTTLSKYRSAPQKGHLE
jgi:hypothetical protein